MASLKVYDGTQWVTIGGVEDHGQLAGLGDVNDHPQYAVVSAGAFTTVNPTSLIGASTDDGLIRKGDFDTEQDAQNTLLLGFLANYHSLVDFNAFSAAPLFSSITFSSNGGTHVLTEGQIAWNDDKKTLDIQTGDDTTLQVGQEQVVRIRNKTGNTLPNGTAVYVSGVQGEKLLVASAVSTKLEEVQYTIGITTSEVSSNGDGFMTTFGHLNDLNTAGWTIGDLVYISPSAGILTNIPPVTPPNHPIRVGIVERVAEGDGRIFVSIDKGEDMHELHDVIGTNPQASGQILYWSTASSAYLVGGHESISGVGTNTHTQIDSHIASGPAHSILLEKSITIESPTDTDRITIMNAVQGYSINSINTVLSGTTPSAAWSVYKGSDRTAGTLIIASGTGSLTGETIPVTGSVSASEYIWLEITSVSGTIDTLHLSMHMGIT